MQCEVQVSERIMRTQVVDIFVVINVVDFNFELVIFLEVVLNADFGHPLRTQVVMNDFSLADLLPRVAKLLEHKEDRVRLGKSIHVCQVTARELKLQLLNGHVR